MAFLHNEKDLETGLHLSQSLSFKAYKTYITAICFLKLYKNKTIRCSFEATSDAADKDKICSICSTPELPERKFCDGLEIKFTSPLGEIQKAMVHQRQLRKALILALVSIRDYKLLDTYKFVFDYY